MSRITTGGNTILSAKYVLPMILVAGSITSAYFVAAVFRTPAEVSENGSQSTNKPQDKVIQQSPLVSSADSQLASAQIVKLRAAEQRQALQVTEGAAAIVSEILTMQAEHKALVDQVTKFNGYYKQCEQAPLPQALYFDKKNISYDTNFAGKNYSDLQSVLAFEKNRKFDLLNRLKAIPGCTKALADLNRGYVTAAELEAFYTQFPGERPPKATASADTSNAGDSSMSQTANNSSNGVSGKMTGGTR